MVSANNNEISRNKIHDNSKDGINVTSSDVNIHNNSLDYNEKKGIYCGSCTGDIIDNYINGEWVKPSGTEVIDVENPATGEVLGQFRASTVKPLWPDCHVKTPHVTADYSRSRCAEHGPALPEPPRPTPRSGWDADESL